MRQVVLLQDGVCVCEKLLSCLHCIQHSTVCVETQGKGKGVCHTWCVSHTAHMVLVCVCASLCCRTMQPA